jgi:hypothetical protein
MALWLYVGWYTGSMLSELFGANLWLGLGPAIVAAAVIAASRPIKASLRTRQLMAEQAPG